jgi:outer membrane protein TolC
MNHSIGAALLTLIGALSACSFAPTYRIPDSSPPGPVYQEAGEWRQAQPFDTEARGPWWMLFHDKTLDELEAKVDGANQNLKAGLARLQAARAATRIARADLFPTLNAASSASRQGTSQHSPTYLSGSEKTFNNFDLNGDLSYEIDLWGRVRNSVNAAKANQQASAADLATLDLELHAELAADYYTLRSEDAEQVLLQETVADYAKSLELTQGLYEGGAAAVADVNQAQAQLETAHT